MAPPARPSGPGGSMVSSCSPPTPMAGSQMRTISSLVKARRSTRRSKMTKWLRSPCILMKGRSLAPCLSFPLFIFVNTFIVPTIEYRTALRPPGLVAQARRNVSPQRAEQEVCRAAGFLVLRNARYIRLRICLSRAPDAGIGTPCRDHRGEGAALTEESMKDREFREWSRRAADWGADYRASLRSEEHTSELQSRENLVCR